MTSNTSLVLDITKLKCAFKMYEIVLLSNNVHFIENSSCDRVRDKLLHFRAMSILLPWMDKCEQMICKIEGNSKKATIMSQDQSEIVNFSV